MIFGCLETIELSIKAIENNDIINTVHKAPMNELTMFQ